MTIGPAPMMRIELMSVRLGMSVYPFSYLREKPDGLARPVLQEGFCCQARRAL